MSTTSKSPRRVLVTAYETAQQCLPDYRHRCSPKVFTQPQLFACLVLKEFAKLDYRGVEAYLRDNPSLVEAIGLKHVPDHSTLHKAARRLLTMSQVRRLLGETLAR
ncbi:MAG TPA: transposase, partial [Pirellulaceae bacterium]|nr:transposase [Pirellulaceae bacterium]